MAKITEMFAFVAEDKDGEGVMAAAFGRAWYPLVGADLERVKSILPIAKEISQKTGIPFKVLKFDNRTDITEEVLK